MTFVAILLGNLKRLRGRLVNAVLSIFFAFLLFGFLSAVGTVFSSDIAVAGQSRLLSTHRSSISIQLPVSYRFRLQFTEGVEAVMPAVWFGGVYQKPTNFFPQVAVEPHALFRVYPEYRLPEAQKQAFLNTKTGAIAGRTLAERYDWQVGDRIPIQSGVWRPAGGSGVLELTLEGIFDVDDPAGKTTDLYFRQDYLDGFREFGQDTVGWYVIRVADPAAAEDVARRIDKMFENSPFETKTTSEALFIKGFANQVGNIGATTRAIMVAVLFSTLLVTASTLIQAARERIGEMATLKALGFSDGHVAGLLLAESTILHGLGGGLGLIAAEAMLRRDFTGGLLAQVGLSPASIGSGVVLIIVLSLLTALVPAAQAVRMPVAEALRRR